MVSLAEAQSSNSQIASTLPAGLVAVFVGATSGIGEATLKTFAKCAVKPRAYFIGRSEEAGKRVAAECKAINPKGKFIFIHADISLIRTVDKICASIAERETAINILFLSTGAVVSQQETEEGLNLSTCLAHHSRARFIQKLIPLLQRSSSLRRVVTVFAGTKEGEINDKDFEGRNCSTIDYDGHVSSRVTMSLEAFARQAPTISFIHDFPGTVECGAGKKPRSPISRARSLSIGYFRHSTHPMCSEESGARHLFLATSARYPPRIRTKAVSGVPMSDGLIYARGTDSKYASGVYTVDELGESAGRKTEEMLGNLRCQGMVQKLWNYTESEFKRIISDSVIEQIGHVLPLSFER